MTLLLGIAISGSTGVLLLLPGRPARPARRPAPVRVR
jgi:hypothetical protein